MDECVVIVNRGRGGVYTYGVNLERTFAEAGISVFSLPDLVSSIRQHKLIAYFRSVLEITVKHKCLCVVSNHYGTARVAKPLSAMLGSKMCIVVHGFAERDAERSKPGSQSRVFSEMSSRLQKADFIIFVSNELKEHYSRTINIKCPTFVLKPCVDVYKFSPDRSTRMRQMMHLDIPAGKFILLTLANLDDETRIRGLRQLLASIQSFDHRKEIELVIAGSGSRMAEIRKEVQEMGLRDNVRFIGHIDPSRMPGVYNLADTFILITEWCGFDLAVLEAMACGLPTVTTKKRDYTESFAEGVEFFSIDYEVNSITKILGDLLEKRDSLAGVGLNAALRIKTDFSLGSRAKDVKRIWYRLFR